MIPHYPPRKRTTGPFEDRITPPPRNGINLSTFAISLTIYPPTCSTGHVYVRGAEFWKFSAARPRKQQSWQTNAGWIGSRPINIKTPNTDDTGGRGREEEGVGRENKKKKKKTPTTVFTCTFPFSRMLVCSFRGLRCLRWCNGNRRYHRAEHSIDLDNLISRRIRFPPSILCKATMIPWRNGMFRRYWCLVVLRSDLFVRLQREQ